MQNFILAHGFGFNNSYWGNLNSFLRGHVFYLDQLESLQEIDTNAVYIGIGHSLGFLKLNNLKLNNSGLKFSHLFCIQGFVNFCGNDSKLNFIRTRFLCKFIENFQTDPSKTLQSFYQKCGAVPPQIQDLGASLNDLLLMQKSFKHCGVQTTVLTDSSDKIMPLSVIDDNFKNLAHVSIKCVTHNSQHLLGYRNSKIIGEAIDEISNQGQF